MEELLKFYEARDYFLGSGNYISPHFIDGLKLLKACQHEEARYVCSLFLNFTDEELVHCNVRKTFLEQGEHPIALCYAGICGFGDMILVEKAAKMDYPYAQGWMATLGGAIGFEWAKKAASNGDRIGLYELGCRFELYEQDKTNAIAAYRKSAELGYIHGMRAYASTFEKTNPERYFWLERVTHPCQNRRALYFEAIQHMEMYEDGRGCIPVLLTLGKMFKGNINVSKQVIFGTAACSKTDVEILCKCVTLYEVCIQDATDAVLAWMFAAKQLGFCRDVARLIGTLVWDNRSDFIKVK
jgi:hypothetical protein